MQRSILVDRVSYRRICRSADDAISCLHTEEYDTLKKALPPICNTQIKTLNYPFNSYYWNFICKKKC